MRERISSMLAAAMGWGLLILGALLVMCGIVWAARTLTGLVMGL